MLHYLTWTQFFLAAGSCLLLYYLIVLLLIYRNELKALLEKTRDRLLSQVSFPSSTPETPPASIMGAVSTQDAPTLSVATAIQVAPRKQEDAQADECTTAETGAPAIAPQAIPMGTLADFQQEIRSLLELVEETQLEKEEFLSLLQLIIARYSPTAQSQDQDKLQQFLLEQSQDQLPFSLTPEDLQGLWPGA